MKILLWKYSLYNFDVIGLLSSYYSLSLNFLYMNFSESLTLFTHNLLARNILNEELQNILLTSLEVNPYDTTTTTWPLLVYPRTLSVLAQVRIVIKISINISICIFHVEIISDYHHAT